MLGEKENKFDLPGFSSVQQTKKNEVDYSFRKKSKQSGFQSMGFSFPVLNGVMKKGYKIPTPIQRKTIPLIMEGRDVVAMAKTGSGKTACFLIPMFEKLKQRNTTAGVRAIILLPTRELAIQTLKFVKELGKFMDLKTILLIGGDSMDSQFSAIHSCPDIIIATPGRFFHLCVEMDLKLKSVGYVVFDEADRLLEMGFKEQLDGIIHRLPESRQVVMFSATLPRLLVDFAKVGLNEPMLVRLDVETKLPEHLILKFIYCRPDERYASLVALLKYMIPENSQTIVFVGTQHHVELISYILTKCGISNTFIYSSLDPSARKINAAKFTHKKVSVLVVTDVAARGIDIPNLDYVINLHFPGKPKLFVHRVGRCARAGKHGIAYSLFSTDDQAHLIDLHLFLNRNLDFNNSNLVGTIPRGILEEEQQTVMKLLQDQVIAPLYKTSENGYKKYLTSRPVASTSSNKKVKEMKIKLMKPLDDFSNLSFESASKLFDEDQNKFKIVDSENDKILLDEKHEIITKMKNYRANETIFELHPHKSSMPLQTMKQKRLIHSSKISNYHKKMNESGHEEKIEYIHNNNEKVTVNSLNNDNEYEEMTSSTQKQYKTKNFDKYEIKNDKLKNFNDKEHFIPYQSDDKHIEGGLAIDIFEKQTKNAELSITSEKNHFNNHRPGLKKWDRLRKKMVTVSNGRDGKIKTESGQWISSSYKTGRYNEWKEKTKLDEQLRRNGENNEEDKPVLHGKRYHNKSGMMGQNPKTHAKKRLGNNLELKNSEQIVKKRLRLEFVKNRELTNKIKKAARKNKRAKK